MNTKKYRWILYIITVTVIATISVQVYWNYKNYQQNKQRVLNEIQISLDTAIEEYFADVTKNSTIAFVDMSGDSVLSKERASAFFGKIDFDTIFKKTSTDSLSNKIKSKKIFKDFRNINPKEVSGISFFRGKKADSVNHLKGFANKIVISISQDSIEFEKLNPFLENELKRKHLAAPFSLNHYVGDSLERTFSTEIIEWNAPIKMFSKSTYLKPNERLELLLENPTREALKRSFSGILLSFLLSLSVISCLFYLLKIINKQKELAEIKNDLISNITHEFKTPITTVSTALEAIETFNAIDDKEKIKKYVSISSLQLKKLHLMVEKLLETATLDSENLLLKREGIDIVKLVKNVSLKNELTLDQKNISFNSFKDAFTVNLDPFHFENAISNLIDNAIKYGGDKIELHLNLVLNNLEITIADNGNSIDKSQRDKIFDKFYRIPKGNTHDVKGFGIGLYYTKKIIEKHGGDIHLIPNSTNTIFKITLPI